MRFLIIKVLYKKNVQYECTFPKVLLFANVKR